MTGEDRLINILRENPRDFCIITNCFIHLQRINGLTSTSELSTKLVSILKEDAGDILLECLLWSSSMNNQELTLFFNKLAVEKRSQLFNTIKNLEDSRKSYVLFPWHKHNAKELNLLRQDLARFIHGFLPYKHHTHRERIQGVKKRLQFDEYIPLPRGTEKYYSFYVNNPEILVKFYDFLSSKLNREKYEDRSLFMASKLEMEDFFTTEEKDLLDRLGKTVRTQHKVSEILLELEKHSPGNFNFYGASDISVKIEKPKVNRVNHEVNFGLKMEMDE